MLGEAIIWLGVRNDCRGVPACRVVNGAGEKGRGERRVIVRDLRTAAGGSMLGSYPYPPIWWNVAGLGEEMRVMSADLRTWRALDDRLTNWKSSTASSLQHIELNCEHRYSITTDPLTTPIIRHARPKNRRMRRVSVSPKSPDANPIILSMAPSLIPADIQPVPLKRWRSWSFPFAVTSMRL